MFSVYSRAGIGWFVELFISISVIQFNIWYLHCCDTDNTACMLRNTDIHANNCKKEESEKEKERQKPIKTELKKIIKTKSNMGANITKLSQ